MINMNDNTKRVVLYCRVSTDDQAKGGSIAHQEKEMRRYCEARGYEIVEVYKEDYSAKTFNRPEMSKICKKYLKRKSGADMLFVLRWNRFTRDVGDGWEYIDKFRQYGVEVNAIEEHLDFSVAEAKIMLSVYLSMAEVDNDKCSTATKDGIHQALLEGKCTNKAPRGYMNVKVDDYNKYVIIDEPVAKLVQYAFNEVAKGQKSLSMVWREVKGKGLKISESSFC